MHAELTPVRTIRPLSEETLGKGRSVQHVEETLPSGAAGTLV